MSLLRTGRFGEGIAEAKKAVELDPLSLIIDRNLGDGFYMARQYDQAIEQERKTLELDPNFIPAHEYLGIAYIQKSMYNEGIAEFEKAVAISPGNTRTTIVARIRLCVAGKRAEAQKVLDRLNELSKQRYVAAVDIARVYLGLGEKDKAFEWLEKAYRDRSIWLHLRWTQLSIRCAPTRALPTCYAA